MSTPAIGGEDPSKKEYTQAIVPKKPAHRFNQHFMKGPGLINRQVDESNGEGCPFEAVRVLVLSFQQRDQPKKRGSTEQEKHGKQGWDILLAIDVKKLLSRGKKSVGIVMSTNVSNELPHDADAHQQHGYGAQYADYSGGL